MTSIYKSTAKVLLVAVAITAGISISVLSTVKESQASIHSIKKASIYNNSQKQADYPTSHYEKRLYRELNMLMPGNKQFNLRFLKFVVTNNLSK